MNIMIQTISAFFATCFFGILFRIPKKQLLFSGVTGAFGWLLYLIADTYSDSIIIANFSGAVGVSFLARFLAKKRKTPITIFLASGIIPLVPGASIYRTMYAMITQDIEQTTFYAVQTLEIAGIIAMAITLSTVKLHYSKKE